jgi:predicted MFS family arabinose efflux permease
VIAESRDEKAKEERFDLAGMAVLCVSLFALVWGIVKSQALGWGDVTVVSSLAASAVGFFLFVLREREAAHPLLPLRLFRRLSLSVGVVLMLMLAFSLFGVVFFLSLYLQRVRGYSPVETGIRTLPLTGMLVFAAPLGGILSARLGPRPPLVVGMTLLGVGMLGLSRLAWRTDYSDIWPWLLAIGFALGLVQAAATQTIVGNAPVRMAGVAGGLQQTALQIGGALGTSVLGAVLSGRVTATLLGDLTHTGVPLGIARQITPYSGYVAQGVAPVSPLMSASLRLSVTEGAFNAFSSALDVAFVVAACIAFAAALLALLVRRGGASEPGQSPL